MAHSFIEGEAKRFLLIVCVGALLFHVMSAARYFFVDRSLQEVIADVELSTLKSLHDASA